MSMPSCVFSMPLDEENRLVDVCGQKLAVLYFKNWIGNTFFGWIFVCQRGFCQSKSQYNLCGRSICVSRQLYTWLWTKKSLDSLKKHFSYFPINRSIDMYSIIISCVTSNGSWSFKNDSKITVATLLMLSTCHVMQNNILCGYCNLKIDFGHWKTCFLGEKLFFKTQNLTLWARKFQIFTEACYT